MFRVGMIDDVAGVSLAGALKNIVAIGAGFCDGLGWGGNAKGGSLLASVANAQRPSCALASWRCSASLWRSLTTSSRRLSPKRAPASPISSRPVRADHTAVLTPGYGGRNRKCAEAFVKTGKPFNVLEAELLNGQKLQGTQTAKEVYDFLKARGKIDDYPLFRTIYRISFEGMNPRDLVTDL